MMMEKTFLTLSLLISCGVGFTTPAKGYCAAICNTCSCGNWDQLTWGAPYTVLKRSNPTDAVTMDGWCAAGRECGDWCEKLPAPSGTYPGKDGKQHPWPKPDSGKCVY